YPSPSWLQRIDDTFRVIGRMMWPSWYLLLFGCIYLLSRLHSIPWKRGLILLALLLQLGDISKAFVYTRASIDNRPAWQTTMTSPIWHQIAHRFSHVVFLQ